MGTKKIRNEFWNLIEILELATPKRVKMATKGTPSHTTQRCTSPPGLLALVPLHEQDDFSRFLYSQFTLWNKERRRCFYQARRYYKHLKLNIFESASSFSSSYSSTSTLITPSFPRSESVKTIRTSIARTFSVSHECTSTVLRASPLKNKRTPWMESEKILRRSTRPSPPNRSARHPSSRAQILTRPPPLKDTSKPLSTSQYARPSSYRASLLSRPPLSKDPPSYKILIDPSSFFFKKRHTKVYLKIFYLMFLDLRVFLICYKLGFCIYIIAEYIVLLPQEG